jgi:xanthine dehydrogenase accessory factor
MKEIKDIISAYDAAVIAGKKTALATVVHVEGSSYRRPGARMLITEDGMLTGAISGGCLEGDALRKALLAINENKNKLVTYDTTDEDDVKFGVQLGCNGIVHILFETIDPGVPNNPLELLKLLQDKRTNAVLCTLFSLNAQTVQPGTQCLYQSGQAEAFSPGPLFTTFSAIVQDDIYLVYEKQETTFKHFLLEEQELTALVEFLPPAISLNIFGAGNDAIPLVAIAGILGWEVNVIDGRRTHVTSERFPGVNKLVLQKADQALNELNLDERSAAVLMTHNYNYDLEILSQITNTTCPYIGVLGPKKKMNRMLEELAAADKEILAANLENVYSPVGLDLGAETAEEIALSICAEIKAVLSGKNGQMLRNKVQSIHQ